MRALLAAIAAVLLCLLFIGAVVWALSRGVAF
jgi:cbb3-type cytochrome oxidase subunit 3